MIELMIRVRIYDTDAVSDTIMQQSIGVVDRCGFGMRLSEIDDIVHEWHLVEYWHGDGLD